MGMFSFIEEGIKDAGDAIGDGIKSAGDRAEKFLTGDAKGAAREAKELAAQQLGREEAFMSELGGIYQPRMDAGNQAFTSISDYYAGNQQPIINQAMNSPMYSSLLAQGEDAIARNAQATGGFRSGTTQQNLAQNSQNVLMDQINQILQGQQYVANAGMGATNAYTQGKGNVLGAIGGTTGQMANIGINRSAQQQNMLGGLISAGANIGASMLAPTPAAKGAQV